MPTSLRTSRKIQQRKRFSYYLLGILLLLTLPTILYVAWSQRSQYTGASASKVKFSGTATLPYKTFTWQDEQPYHLRISEAQGLLHEGKLYVFGGFNGFHTGPDGKPYLKAVQEVFAYNLKDSWGPVDKPETKMPLALTHSPVAVDGDAVYFVGGFDGNHPGPSINTVFRYNLKTKEWSDNFAKLPAFRGSGAVGVIGRNLHYVGGALRRNESTSNPAEYIDSTEHWVLNLDNPVKWESKAPLLYSRNHVGSVVLDGKLYVIGGQTGENERGGNLSYTEVYDPATDTWTRLADMPTPRGHITSSVLAHNGLIFVLAGTKDGGDNGLPSEHFEVFDPVKNVWMKMPSMPIRSYNGSAPLVQARKSPVAGFWKGKLYTTTGEFGPHSSATKETWSVQIDGVWETLTSLPMAMGDMVTAQISNKVYVMSGTSPETRAYNLSKDAWNNPSQEPLPNRPFPGEQQVAETINGKVYVLGGVSAGKGKLQIFDPDNNTWQVGPDLPRALTSVSTAVINGKLYVAGGHVANRQISQAVYEFDPVKNVWAKRRNMPKAVRFAAGGTDGALMYVFGGEGYNVVTQVNATPGLSRPTGDETSSTRVLAPQNWVQIYNPATNQWTRQIMVNGQAQPARMPQNRSLVKKAEFWQDKFYLFGGQMAVGTREQKTYTDYLSFDPKQNTWSLVGSLKEPRFGLSPIRLGSRVYLFGGGSALSGSTVEQSIKATQTVDVLNL